MTTHERDTLARLRHEATTHRTSARRLNALARQTRNPLMRLHYSSCAAERRAAARAAEGEARDIRDRLRMAAIAHRHVAITAPEAS